MYSDHLNSTPSWCSQEFAGIDLKDARLASRCQTLAVAMSAQPCEGDLTHPLNSVRMLSGSVVKISIRF
ncbi:MAG: hypothetical protein GY805_34770 [Chloroflexi bacterium]|nr:hypothetical protein [Chloroflexota bacterium]